MSRQAFLLCYRCRKVSPLPWHCYFCLPSNPKTGHWQIVPLLWRVSATDGKVQTEKQKGRKNHTTPGRGGQFQPQVKQRSGCTGQHTLLYQRMGSFVISIVICWEVFLVVFVVVKSKNHNWYSEINTCLMQQWIMSKFPPPPFICGGFPLQGLGGRWNTHTPCLWWFRPDITRIL